MAKITRVLQKIFASNASNNGQFGSAKAGTFVTSNSIATLQSLSAYVNGWNDATLTSEKLPTLEETQALNYINTTQLAYIFQEGVPEYEAATTYYINSIVKKPTTYQLYGSIVDDNMGNALTDATKWVLLCDLSDVASKSYVDSIVAGLSPKASVRVVTTGALTATYANGTSGVGATLTNSGALAAIVLDGVSLAVNDRVLVKDQAAPEQNGIYRVTTVGSGAAAWVITRTTDYDTSAEIIGGTYTVADEGTANTGTLWIMTTNGTITVGTTGIVFTPLTLAVAAGYATIAYVDAARRGMIVFRVDSGYVSVAGTTVYLSCSGQESIEGNASIRMPFACTIRNLYVNSGGSPSAGQSFAFTVRKNGANTALTATISDAANTASDVVNSFTVAAGDYLTVSVAASALAADSGGLSATVEIFS